MQDEQYEELVLGYLDFKMTAKLLGHAFDIPHMQAMEKLSRVFGYSCFHEVAAKFGPNGTRSRCNPRPSAEQLERRLVQFFGPIADPISPKLTRKLLRLARLTEVAAMC